MIVKRYEDNVAPRRINSASLDECVMTSDGVQTRFSHPSVFENRLKLYHGEKLEPRENGVDSLWEEENENFHTQVNKLRNERKLQSDSTTHDDAWVNLFENKCQTLRTNLAETLGSKSTKNSRAMKARVSVLEETNLAPPKFCISPLNSSRIDFVPILSNKPSGYFVALERYSDWFFEWTPPEQIETKLNLITPKKNEVVLAWLTSINFRLKFRPLPFKLTKQTSVRDVSVQTNCTLLAGFGPKRNKYARLKDWLRKRFKSKSHLPKVQEDCKKNTRANNETTFLDEKPNQRSRDACLPANCIESSSNHDRALLQYGGIPENSRVTDCFCWKGQHLRSSNIKKIATVGTSPRKPLCVSIIPALSSSSPRRNDDDEMSRGIDSEDTSSEYQLNNGTDRRQHDQQSQERSCVIKGTLLANGVSNDMDGPIKYQEVEGVRNKLERRGEDGKVEDTSMQIYQSQGEDGVHVEINKTPAEIEETISRFDEVRRKFLDLASDLRLKALNATDEMSRANETTNERVMLKIKNESHHSVETAGHHE